MIVVISMAVGAVIFAGGVAAGWKFREWAEDYYFGDGKEKPDVEI